MLAVLRRWPATCLERALVLQRWLLAHEEAREIVIGVKGSGEQREVHAWVVGLDDPPPGSFAELHRLGAHG